MNANDFDFKDLTEKIIGCAYRVYNSMGFGYVESVYEKCMVIELRKIGLIIEIQKAIVATGKPIGLLINFGERSVEVKRKLRELDRV